MSIETQTDASRVFQCKVFHVIDGDKIELRVAACEDPFVVKLDGVRCLSSKGGVTTREVVAGKAAKAFTVDWIAKHFCNMSVIPIMERPGDYYGIIEDRLTGETLNDALVAAGHATVREEK